MWPAFRTLLSAVQHRCLRPCATPAATRAPTSEVPHKSHTCARAQRLPLTGSPSRSNSSREGQESGGGHGELGWHGPAPVFAQLRPSPGAAPHKAPAAPQPPGGRGATIRAGPRASPLPSPRPPLAGETRRSGGGAGRGWGGARPSHKEREPGWAAAGPAPARPAEPQRGDVPARPSVAAAGVISYLQGWRRRLSRRAPVWPGPLGSGTGRGPGRAAGCPCSSRQSRSALRTCLFAAAEAPAQHRASERGASAEPARLPPPAAAAASARASAALPAPAAPRPPAGARAARTRLVCVCPPPNPPPPPPDAAALRACAAARPPRAPTVRAAARPLGTARARALRTPRRRRRRPDPGLQLLLP